MAFHDDWLALARSLIPPHPGPHSPPPMQLRRGVSTAYYALFHLLVHEAVTRIIAHPALHAELGRSIDHGPTRAVCKEYADAKLVGGALTTSSGDVIPNALQDIGRAFVMLLEARQRADYDTDPARDFNPADAYDYLVAAEMAFLDWGSVQGDPAALHMLTKIFKASLTRRRT